MKRTINPEALQIMILDVIEQVLELPKNQREYYSGKKHAHTIKTEILTDAQGKILRVSRPYPRCIHAFEIRKKEGSLPAVPILVDKACKTSIRCQKETKRRLPDHSSRDEPGARAYTRW